MTLKDRLEALVQAMDEPPGTRAWNRATAECARAQDLIPCLALALQDCADEAESWIDDHYDDTPLTPDQSRRYERDIACVNKAHAVLQELEGRLK